MTKNDESISFEDAEYQEFINSILYYIRVFENVSISIDDIMEWPYFLYNDLIVKQVEMKKKEKQHQKQNQNQTQLG